MDGKLLPVNTKHVNFPPLSPYASFIRDGESAYCHFLYQNTCPFKPVCGRVVIHSPPPTPKVQITEFSTLQKKKWPWPLWSFLWVDASGNKLWEASWIIVYPKLLLKCCRHCISLLCDVGGWGLYSHLNDIPVSINSLAYSSTSKTTDAASSNPSSRYKEFTLWTPHNSALV